MKRDMPTTTKFRFNTQFDSEPPPRLETPVPEAVPEAVITEADLATARAQAFAEGRDAGLVDVGAAAQAAQAEALAALAQQLAEIVPRHEAALAACRKDAIDIARAVVRKIVCASELETAVRGVEHMIASFMPRLLDEPRIVVRVSDELLDMLREKVPSLAESSGYRGGVILLSEPGMPTSDCRIEWADGGVERVSEALWREIDAAIESFLADADRDATPAPAEAQDMNAEEKPHG